jgi:hypothetical protein
MIRYEVDLITRINVLSYSNEYIYSPTFPRLNHAIPITQGRHSLSHSCLSRLVS